MKLNKILVLISVLTLTNGNVKNVYGELHKDLNEINIFTNSENYQIKGIIYDIEDYGDYYYQESKIALKSISNGENKSYMDLNKITCEESKQYKMKSKYKLDKRGHYYYKENGYTFYIVALGSYFGNIGDKFKIELDSGITFYAMIGDEKADKDTYSGYCHKCDYSVIEFIINTRKAKKYYGVGENGYILNGNFNNSKEWKGKIKKVWKLK